VELDSLLHRRKAVHASSSMCLRRYGAVELDSLLHHTTAVGRSSLMCWLVKNKYENNQNKKTKQPTIVFLALEFSRCFICWIWTSMHQNLYLCLSCLVGFHWISSIRIHFQHRRLSIPWCTKFMGRLSCVWRFNSNFSGRWIHSTLWRIIVKWDACLMWMILIFIIQFFLWIKLWKW